MVDVFENLDKYLVFKKRKRLTYQNFNQEIENEKI